MGQERSAAEHSLGSSGSSRMPAELLAHDASKWMTPLSRNRRHVGPTPAAGPFAALHPYFAALYSGGTAESHSLTMLSMMLLKSPPDCGLQSRSSAAAVSGLAW